MTSGPSAPPSLDANCACNHGLVFSDRHAARTNAISTSSQCSFIAGPRHAFCRWTTGSVCLNASLGTAIESPPQ